MLSRPEVPVDPSALERTLAPAGESFNLPAEAYSSQEVFAWEMRHFFEGSWVCVGRSADLAVPGDQAAFGVGTEGILLVRDEAGVLRGFFNACRHRGHELLPRGQSASRRTIRCPYHAWVYGLEGGLRGAPSYEELERAEFGLIPARVAEWQGWVFVNASGDAPDFADHIGNLEEEVADHEPGRLVVAASHEYELAANWKLVHENYHECYHCSSIHPELCKVTPPDSGVESQPTGAWAGGSMELRPHADTMSLSGESRGTPLRGLDERQRREVYYYGLFPNLLISLHPDYVLTHRLVPLAADRTWIECQWLFSPEDVERPGFDPSYAVEFWDLTNRQDWQAIESVQRGASSRGYRQGPLSSREICVRQFETIVAKGYLEGRPGPPAPPGPAAGVDSIAPGARSLEPA